MKILRKSERGNVLMVTLITGATLIIGLASYFTLVSAQYNSVARSQSWNSAIPAAEAGVEDALTHLNTVGDGSRGTNGYSYSGGLYNVSRSLSSLRYSVGVDTNWQPTIYSTGYVRANWKYTNEISRIVKVTTTRFGSGMKGMVALGNITMNGNCDADSYDGDDPLHSTNGAYDATKKKDLSYVGSVQGSVDTGGGKVAGNIATGGGGSGAGNVGDFPWLSSHSGIEPGHYAKDLNAAFPPATVPFSGGATTPETGVSVVITNYATNTIVITTNVYPNPVPAGGVSSSTATYTSTTYPTGQSGITTNTTATSSKTFPTAGTYIGNVVTRVVTTGAQSGRGTWYDYSRITGYNYTTTVYTYSNSSITPTYTTNTYNYALRSGNYENYSWSSSGQDTMIVLGDAVWYVDNDFSMAGQSTIIIAPGASLKLYVGGNASLAGNGIANQSGNTLKFSFYGLPGCTSLSLSGNASFTGSFYAPNADFTLNGGGNNDYDFAGASVTKTVSMHGHFHFHYDERLGRQGGQTRYTVASWSEL